MAHAAEIKVMATAGFQEAYLELVPEFERTTGHKVVTLWAPTVDVMSRIKDGETVDLVIMAGASVDELIKLGKIVPGSRVDIATSGILWLTGVSNISLLRIKSWLTTILY